MAGLLEGSARCGGANANAHESVRGLLPREVVRRGQAVEVDRAVEGVVPALQKQHSVLQLRFVAQHVRRVDRPVEHARHVSCRMMGQRVTWRGMPRVVPHDLPRVVPSGTVCATCRAHLLRTAEVRERARPVRVSGKWQSVCFEWENPTSTESHAHARCKRERLHRRSVAACSRHRTRTRCRRCRGTG